MASAVLLVLLALFSVSQTGLLCNNSTDSNSTALISDFFVISFPTDYSARLDFIESGSFYVMFTFETVSESPNGGQNSIDYNMDQQVFLRNCSVIGSNSTGNWTIIEETVRLATVLPNNATFALTMTLYSVPYVGVVEADMFPLGNGSLGLYVEISNWRNVYAGSGVTVQSVMKTSASALGIHRSFYPDGNMRQIGLDGIIRDIQIYVPEQMQLTTRVGNTTVVTYPQPGVSSSVPSYSSPIYAYTSMSMPDLTNSTALYSTFLEPTVPTNSVPWLWIIVGVVSGVLMLGILLGVVCFVWRKFPELRMKTDSSSAPDTAIAPFEQPVPERPPTPQLEKQKLLSREIPPAVTDTTVANGHPTAAGGSTARVKLRRGD